MSDENEAPPSVPGYRTGRLLGFGASGEVWSAVSDTGEDVALKVLRTRGDPAGEHVNRLLRETAVLRRVDHDHVVRLRAVVESPGFGPVLVMARAHGGSLAALVAARGPLDVGEVVTVLTPLAGALADLHELGLVHGDVSPGNVLFDDRARPMLGDLGLARIVGEPEPAAVDGTPGYADPARLRGATPTPASDVHALAAVGWLALTGQAPQPPGERPPLVALAPEVPPDLAQVLEAALSGDPAQRPSARELAVRCFDAAPAVPVRLVPTDPAAAAAEVVTHRLRAAAIESSAAASARRRTLAVSRPRLLTALGVVAVLLLGSAAAVAAPRLLAADPPTAAEARSSEPVETPGAIREALAGDDPVLAVPALAWLRARAFATGDPAPLREANAPGAQALADDVARLAALESRDVVLEGLGFDVRSVTVVSRNGDEVVVEADVVTLAHRQVAGDGTMVASVPQDEERRSRLVLRRSVEGWQVVRVG